LIPPARGCSPAQRDRAFRGQFRHTPKSLPSNDAEPNELVVIADTKTQRGSLIEIRSKN
jgi:hypothetical protein